MHILEDETITWKAKGLFSFLLNAGIGPNTPMRILIGSSKDGHIATARALKELIDAGYVTIKKIRNKGKIIGCTRTLFKNGQQASKEQEKET